MEIKPKTLIIQIPYAGFGDHLFHSHLPRIAKETKAYDKVFISSKSFIRQQDHMDIVWKLNPFVDGIIDEIGKTCDLEPLVEESEQNKDYNLLDRVMFAFGLDDGKRWHDPEIYYTPKYLPEYNKSIFDPNHFAYKGNFNTDDLYSFFKKNNIVYDAIMKLRITNPPYRKKHTDLVIDAPNVYDLCDVINSSKHILCFTSGTATLTAALGKKATIFYAEGISTGFHHSKTHNYLYVNNNFKTRLINFIKKPFSNLFHKFRT